MAAAGAAIVAGSTTSSDFPTTTGAPRKGPSDAFVTRLTPAGTAFATSTCLGGSDVDAADAVAVDTDGRVVVAGRTLSDDFPTANPAQANDAAALDAFAAQLDGTTPLMSTYLGGSGGEVAHGVALDPGGNAYVTGRTEGTFPDAGAGDDDHRAPARADARPGGAVPLQREDARPVQPDRRHLVRLPARRGAFTPCASPLTTKKLSLAARTFEVRAVNASGVADPTPAAFAFLVTQPRPEVKRYACALEPVGAYHDRGTRDWGPCDREVPCPRASACLLDLAVDEHDDSYLFNYDVHLQHFEAGAYKERGQRAPGLRDHRDDPAPGDRAGPGPGRRREPEPAVYAPAPGQRDGGRRLRRSGEREAGALEGAREREGRGRGARPAAVERRREKAAPQARADREADDRVPAGRRAGAHDDGGRQAQASGGETPFSDSGRGPKIRRSLSLIATSLMLASRRRM